MRGLLIAQGPNQEDDPAIAHGQALKSEFAMVLSIVFDRDQGVTPKRMDVDEGAYFGLAFTLAS